ncbi:MAG: hypothetical protein EGS50_11225 [Alistipes senegalensis]|nr:hypothetical protein [Alistipes senegalensis]
MGAYYRVKADVAELVLREITRIEADPKLSQSLSKKNKDECGHFLEKSYLCRPNFLMPKTDTCRRF